MKNHNHIEGGCLCGATRYRATDDPYKVLYCHCTSCRRASGAPVVVWLMFDKGQVEFTEGIPRKYASSPGVLRGFCSICGTPFWWEGIWDDKPIQMVLSGSLDDPEQYLPQGQTNCHNKLSWLEITDDLPHYSHASPKNGVFNP